jgi:hypothetical protein
MIFVFSLCLVELIVLLSNSTIFKSSSISAEEKLRFGYLVIFVVSMIIVTAVFRLIQTYLVGIRDCMKLKKFRKDDNDAVKPVELSVVQPQTTRVCVSSALSSDENAQATTTRQPPISL